MRTHAKPGRETRAVDRFAQKKLVQASAFGIEIVHVPFGCLEAIECAVSAREGKTHVIELGRFRRAVVAARIGKKDFKAVGRSQRLLKIHIRSQKADELTRQTRWKPVAQGRPVDRVIDGRVRISPARRRNDRLFAGRYPAGTGRFGDKDEPASIRARHGGDMGSIGIKADTHDSASNRTGLTAHAQYALCAAHAGRCLCQRCGDTLCCARETMIRERGGDVGIGPDRHDLP